MYHPKADTNIKRKYERRGLLQIAVTYKTQTVTAAEYCNTKHKCDQFVNIIKCTNLTEIAN